MTSTIGASNGLTTLKCVVVGDGATGKTSLLLSYTANKFDPDRYVPTVFENYAALQAHQGAAYSLSLWDTAGQEEYASLRPLSYAATDVFVVAFSTIARASFANVAEHWVDEVRRHVPDAAVVLVGTKSDLRGDAALLERLAARNETPVSVDEGDALARKLQCTGYVECSAATQRGVPEVFTRVIEAHLERRAQLTAAARRRKKASSSTKGKMTCVVS